MVISYHACFLCDDEDTESFSTLVCRFHGKENREPLPSVNIALTLLTIDSGVRMLVKSGTRVGKHAVTIEAQASMCAQTSFQAAISSTFSDFVRKKDIVLTSEFRRWQ